MKSLGLVEVSGVTAAIDCLDIMCKSAEVEFVTWERPAEEQTHGVLGHARVGGGIAVETQKQVMQNEEQAGADLDDTQAGGLLALEGNDDQSHGAKAQDLTQDKERGHNGLLVGGIGFHYSTEIRICKGKITENFSVALTDGIECDTIWSRSNFDRL